jgi:hypothetical protein
VLPGSRKTGRKDVKFNGSPKLKLRAFAKFVGKPVVSLGPLDVGLSSRNRTLTPASKAGSTEGKSRRGNQTAIRINVASPLAGLATTPASMAESTADSMVGSPPIEKSIRKGWKLAAKRLIGAPRGGLAPATKVEPADPFALDRVGERENERAEKKAERAKKMRTRAFAFANESFARSRKPVFQASDLVVVPMQLEEDTQSESEPYSPPSSDLDEDEDLHSLQQNRKRTAPSPPTGVIVTIKRSGVAMARVEAAAKAAAEGKAEVTGPAKHIKLLPHLFGEKRIKEDVIREQALEEQWRQTKTEIIARENLKLPVLLDSQAAGPMKNVWATMKRTTLSSYIHLINGE